MNTSSTQQEIIVLLQCKELYKTKYMCELTCSRQMDCVIAAAFHGVCETLRTQCDALWAVRGTREGA